MKRIFINCISVVAILFCVYIYYSSDNVNITINSNKMYYLKSYSTSIVERVDSENIIKCDLSAVSNAVNSLLDNGFELEKSTYTKDYMDLILSKDDEIYRLYYTKDKILTSISKPYKNSVVPITYINEKKK